MLKLLPAAIAIATITPTVSAVPTLFEQGPAITSGTVASDSIDVSMFTQGDNFSLAQNALVTGVTFSGEYQFVSEFRDDSFTISIHTDDAGLPAASPVFQTTTASIVRTPTGVGSRATYEATFDSPPQLPAGAYWLAIQNATSTPGSVSGRWGWARVNTDGDRARIFGSQSPDWEPFDNGDLAFSICGFTANAPTHFWDFEGNGRDHAGLADGVPGANVQFADPSLSPEHLFALGRALTADASGALNDQIVVPAGAYAPLGSNDFTISLAYKRGVEDTGASDQDIILTVPGAGGWLLRALDDTMDFLAGTTSVRVTSDAVSFDPSGSEWRHVAIVCDRDGMTTWYIDGVASGPATPSSTLGALNSSEDLHIGGGAFLGIGLDGSLDRLRVYHSALAPAQVRSLAREVIESDNADCETDFNNDGVTDSTDLATLLAGWGACP